jgi:hypothetical protein
MEEVIYFRNVTGVLRAWRRTHIRDLQIATSIGGPGKTCDEKFLEDLVANHPDLLGLAGADDDSDIEGPFRAFTQVSLRALNGRMIAPDLVLLSRSGHIVVVEVKLSDNPELRDRQVVAQLLEYAASFTKCTDDDCLRLFGGENCEATTWAGFVQSLFPDAPERLARRFLDKFRTGRLHLVIACDDAPRGLRELVRGVVGQHALGEYDFRVVEIAPYVAEGTNGEVIFLPHVVLETEIVARSSVTVSLPEGERQPSINVSVTPLDEVQERLTEKQVGKLWTAEELAEAYRSLTDQQLSQRLLRLLQWAVERKCLIITGRKANPGFRLRGVTGKRIMSFRQSGNHSLTPRQTTTQAPRHVRRSSVELSSS